jgi:hypothetical protein
MTDSESRYEQRRLDTAIDRTTNEKLDPPFYLFSGLSLGEERKLEHALGGKYTHITPRGRRFHPLALEYYKRWGNRYLEGLLNAKPKPEQNENQI